MSGFNNLLTCQLQGVEGTEVVVSHVTVPPDTTLPKHWHPGEEFAYILEGTLVLCQENEPEMVFKKGDVCVVPWKKIHTVKTMDESVTILVFRVHEQGQPERILVE
jgi:quercetin dioxygenase-like cupin family protein